MLGVNLTGAPMNRAPLNVSCKLKSSAWFKQKFKTKLAKKYPKPQPIPTPDEHYELERAELEEVVSLRDSNKKNKFYKNKYLNIPNIFVQADTESSEIVQQLQKHHEDGNKYVRICNLNQADHDEWNLTYGQYVTTKEGITKELGQKLEDESDFQFIYQHGHKDCYMYKPIEEPLTTENPRSQKIYDENLATWERWQPDPVEVEKVTETKGPKFKYLKKGNRGRIYAVILPNGEMMNVLREDLRTLRAKWGVTNKRSNEW